MKISLFSFKALAIFALANLFISIVKGQSAEKINYQAIIRSSDNSLVANTQLNIRINILQGSITGESIYSETQSPTSNANGLVNIKIGGGTQLSGNFSNIDWAEGPYFIKIETKMEGDIDYQLMGISELISVPYALYAKSSDYNNLNNKPTLFNGNWSSLSGKPNTVAGYGITDLDLSGAFLFDLLRFNGTKWVRFTPNYLTSFTETDPIFGASPSKGITSTLITNWNTAYDWGNHNGLYRPIDWVPSWTDVTGKPTFFDGQYSSLTGAPTKVSSFINDTGYLTNEVDGSVSNELQTLSISHDTVYLSNGGFVKLPNRISNVNIHNDSLYITHSYGEITYAGYVGNGSPGSSLPTVNTVGVSGIVYTGGIAEGNVTSAGGEYVVSRGICLSTLHNPTLSDTIYASGNGYGAYSINIGQLVADHTYYIRAYATNVIGTSYGNELSFHTSPMTTPTLTTNAVYNISHTTAMSGGDITDNGGSDLIERGICWSLTSPPTIADNKNAQGNSTGSFNAIMSGLTANTLYYVKAYATNAQGTAYGNELSFTTNTLSLASITTNSISSISYTTAVSGGNVTNDNGSSVTSRGVCWSTSTMPLTSNSKYTEAAGLGAYTATLTGLLPNTLYYIRAFAVNGAGTVYGNQYSFTTLTLSAPVLTTKSISGISSNIAGSGGNITSDGGANITAKGVCWGINTSPSLSNNFTNDGTGSLSYNSTMNGLNPLTKYYVRAYATNSKGTTFGNELNFTTTDLVSPGPSVPTLGTSPSAITGSSTASSGGYVSSDGGSNVTMRGVCWSTSQTPTLDNNYSVDGGSGTGYFSSTITGLSGCGTIYYVRAYATNNTGTGYGNQNTISTGLLPSISTDDVTNISYYTAVSGGSISDDGGCPVTEKGVCWSYNTSPTIGNYKTTEGAGNGTFVSNITGLYANRTYYVRAYATNSVGTVYGPEKVFTSATPSTPYIGQNYAGGIVFYLDGTGNHGLVCSPSDQGGYNWGCEGASIPTSNDFGTGATNTAAMVASCAEANTAAKICDNLTLNGYSDWFLPSSAELSLMFSNLGTRGLGNFTIGYQYNTSSQADANRFNYAYISQSNIIYTGWNYKENATQVRAVRAF